jgi:Na+/melibiose symporter-like transporter
MGYLSDISSKLTKGRRRPFMVVGSLLVGVNLIVIGWTREIGSWFLSPDSDNYQLLVIWIAVVSFYLLDFAINAGFSVGGIMLIYSASRLQSYHCRYTSSTETRDWECMG